MTTGRRLFDWCCAFVRARADVRVKVSAHQERQYRAIASLPLCFGTMLDDADITETRQLVHVARAEGEGELVERFREVMLGKFPEHVFEQMVFEAHARQSAHQEALAAKREALGALLDSATEGGIGAEAGEADVGSGDGAPLAAT